MDTYNSNTLHPSVGSSRQSGYSALAAAMPAPAGGIPGTFRLPQTVYAVPSKHSSGRGLSAPITFDIKGAGGRGSGVAMRDLCARSVSGLHTVVHGGEDRVVHMVAGGRMTFRIMWPGYSHLPAVYNVDIAAEPSMTRARLGQIIAQAFMRFIEAYRHTPSTVPTYSIAAGTGIRLEHLFLLSVQNTCDDSWQADVVVDVR